MKNDNLFYRHALKTFGLLLIGIVLCRVTNGFMILPLALVGIVSALRGRILWPLALYAFFSFCIVVNTGILPKSGLFWGFGLRVGVLAISIALAVGRSNSRGGFKLPLGTLIPFFIAAGLSIPDSWVPKISILKLIQFSLFFLGVWLGTQNLQSRPEELYKLRVMFFAFGMFFVLGSVAAYPFPAISYATSLGAALRDGNADAAIAEFVANKDSTTSLFCGVANHSQALAPILAIVFSWVLCDMLFVERRFRWLHVIMLLLAMPMLYMTRSRVAFTSAVAAMSMIYFYTSKMVYIPPIVRKRLGNGLTVFAVVTILAAVVLELQNKTITRWLRKTEDVAGDTRSLSEAVTESRQGLMEESMMEFHRNPLFGSGFQTAWYHQNLYSGKGLILSASIEKGVLPLMVLGETGVVGEITFVIFIIGFTFASIRKKYFVSLTMFAVFFVTNLGEATFFSPGGIGGIEWIFCLVGGFLIDTIVLTRNRNEMYRKVGWYI